MPKPFGYGGDVNRGTEADALTGLQRTADNNEVKDAKAEKLR